jgi:hypothetical protein
MLRSSFHKRQRGYKKMGYILIDEKGLFKWKYESITITV